MDVDHSSGSSNEEDASTGESDLEEDEEGNDSEESEWKGIAMDVDDNVEDDDSAESMQDTREAASEAPAGEQDEGYLLVVLIEPPASKYIPPHLRKAVTQDDEKNVRLLRQLKGQLNR
jgi:nucleolar MIF4G domain-containing protein 1